MSDRQMVMDLLSNMPEETPMDEILRRIELIAGIEHGLEQAHRREGKSGEEMLALVKKWASQ